MNATEIQISRKLTTELLHLAQQSPDKEVCGLIGAKNGKARTCYPIDNIANEPEKRFQMHVKQQINAFATMREKQEEIFAIYHSHPTAPPLPSLTDIELANYPNAIYLIISLNMKGVLEMRGFKIMDATVEEISLNLIEC